MRGLIIGHPDKVHTFCQAPDADPSGLVDLGDVARVPATKQLSLESGEGERACMLPGFQDTEGYLLVLA